MIMSSASTWARAAISGTTPPYAACSSICESTILDRIFPGPASGRSTTAAAVSSQVVSMPSTSIPNSIHALFATWLFPFLRYPVEQFISVWDRVGTWSNWLDLRGHRVPSTVLRIGTRGSPLALAQARLVRDALGAAHGLDGERIALEVIRTTGDMIRDRPLTDAGGKGLFTKEIEEALVRGTVDLAVHSAKDMQTELPAVLVIAAALPREDPRDVFISLKSTSLRDLPRGAVIGSASLRRQSLVKHLRPDLSVVTFRGNVETRLRKLEEGAVDATLLALAGLKRLGLEKQATAVFSVDEFLPAVGQGIIAIEARADDTHTRALLASIDHAATRTALAVERAFLAVLDGSCRTPIAGYARIDGGGVSFRGLIARPNGSEVLQCERRGGVADAAALGADAGRELKARAGENFFAPA